MFDPRPALDRAQARLAELTAQVFAAGRFLAGEQVRSLEAELARDWRSAYAVTCGSGTAAIELCLRAVGVDGGEVIVPANTSLFTAQAVLAAGARLRVADVDPVTLQLTAEAAAAAWTPQTRAVIGVHLYGNPCPVDALAEFCRQRGAVLVQDACQAHGLQYRGQPLSAFGPAAYSFYPTKNLGGVGDGGAVLTDCADLAARLRLLRDGGRDADQFARLPAINSRLSELEAACLRALLPHLEHWNAHRRQVADVYTRELAAAPAVRPVPPVGPTVRHLYVVRSAERDRLRQHLAAAGIETGIHYPYALHEQPAFAACGSWAAEPQHAARACREVLSLPIGPHVDAATACWVATEIRRFAP
jgi:dTDP-3-amino-3,4,6-trideoxy-alpha-D-glucose transaminase